MKPSKSMHYLLWQSDMQSETESAVYGILSEDPTLPRMSPVRYPGHVGWNHGQSEYYNYESGKNVSTIRHDEEEKQRKLKSHASFLRGRVDAILMKDQKKRMEEEQRMKIWRNEQKLEEGRRIEIPPKVKKISHFEDKEWVASLRSAYEEVAKTRNLTPVQQHHRTKSVVKTKKMTPYKMPLKKKMEDRFDIDMYKSKYAHWRSSTSHGITQNNQSYSPHLLTNAFDTAPETDDHEELEKSERFEDLIISDSDDDCEETEEHFEDIVLSESDDDIDETLHETKSIEEILREYERQKTEPESRFEELILSESDDEDDMKTPRKLSKSFPNFPLDSSTPLKTKPLHYFSTVFPNVFSPINPDTTSSF